MRQTVSIVIPTYRRVASLISLLNSLSKIIDKKVSELIIIEQETSNGDVYKDIVKKLGIPMKYIFLRKRSTPRAMNIGVSKANSRYILFLDDDVTVRVGLILNHLTNFTRPSVVATVGRVITDGQKIEANRLDTGRVNWLGSFTEGFSSTVKQEVDTVIGANNCWRKEIYQKLGGMDEQFTGNAMRLESDLSLRAKKLGYKILFEPKAVVVHHRAKTGGARKSEGRLQWYFDFFSNETYFFLKHRSRIFLPIFLMTKIEWMLRCMFGFGREVSVRSLKTPFLGIVDGVKKYKQL